MSKENQTTVKDIVSLMHTLLTSYNISQKEHSWETPPACGKIITGHKDGQNNIVYSLRRSNLTPICTISDEVIDRNGKVITNNLRVLNRIHNQIHQIAHNLGPDCY